MQLNSPTTGLYACVVLLLALHSNPVEEDNLEEEGTLAMADSLVGEGNLEEEEILVVVHIPVEVSNLEEDSLAVVHILVEEGNLVVARAPGVDILEVAFAAQPCRIVAARVDQDLPLAFLLVAVQVVVLRLVVRLAVPGCSFVSPS